MSEKAKWRGFGSMDPARVKELAGQGGRKAHAMGVAHKWNSETASSAGRIGGQVYARNLKQKSRKDFDTGQIPDPPKEGAA